MTFMADAISAAVKKVEASRTTYYAGRAATRQGKNGRKTYLSLPDGGCADGMQQK